MSSGWEIYTKLSVGEMTELFRPLPIYYPGIFDFYGSNKILVEDKPSLIASAHYITDPYEVFTGNSERDEYDLQTYKEIYPFVPASWIIVDLGPYGLYNDKGFLHFIDKFLSEIDHFLVHTSTGGFPGILPDDFEPPEAYRLKDMRKCSTG